VAQPDYRTCAKAGIGALARWYDPSSGLRWNTTSSYKNAVTNELFLTLAADRADAARQSSALDALIAAAALTGS